MRIREIYHRVKLRENVNLDQLVQQFGERIMQKAVYDNAMSSEWTALDAIKQISKLDPTDDKQMLPWLVKAYAKGQFKVEEKERVTTALQSFLTRRSKYPAQYQDLNKFRSLDDLEAKFLPRDNEAEQDKELVKNQAAQAKANSEFIVDAVGFKVVKPKTKEAAQFYGKGTNWDISTIADNKFDMYTTNRGTSEGHEFLIIFAFLNKQPRRFIMSFTDATFLDEHSNAVSDADISLLSANPEYSKFMANELEIRAKDVIENKVSEMEDWEAEEYDAFDDDEVPTFAYEWVANPSKMPGYAAIFDDLRKKTFYAYREKELLAKHKNQISASKDERELVWYAISQGERLPPDKEEIVKNGGRNAADYAIKVLKQRWPEAEPNIFKHAHVAKAYFDEFIDDRDPDIEKYLIDHATEIDNGTFVSYARSIGERWPEAESYIIAGQYGYEAIRYASDVLRERWPALEKNLLEKAKLGDKTTAYTLYDYCEKVIKGPWPAAEPYLINSPYNISYALHLKNERWPEAEQYMVNSGLQQKQQYEERFGVKLPGST